MTNVPAIYAFVNGDVVDALDPGTIYPEISKYDVEQFLRRVRVLRDIRSHPRDPAPIELALAMARGELKSGRARGIVGALSLYNGVLEAEPGNAEADSGLRLVLRELDKFPERASIVSRDASSSSAGTRQSETAKDSSPALDRLAALIGLPTVKREIASLANLLKVQALRRERGMPASPVSLHIVVHGSTGDGQDDGGSVAGDNLSRSWSPQKRASYRG